MTELHPAFRDLHSCTIEPDDNGYWLLGYGTYSSGVLQGEPLFRRILWGTKDEVQQYFDDHAPKGMKVKLMHEGDFEGVKWMSGSGAPDPLDDTDY